MGILEEIQADQARTRAALVNLAGDIQALTAKIVPGMSPETVRAIKEDGQRIADAAEALAAETPDEPPAP